MGPGLSNTPPAAGVRLPWRAIPRRVRVQIEDRLGARILKAETQPGGFSPAVAVRVLTAAGTRAFVKAVPPDINPESPAIYRREAEVVSRFPPGVPVPRLLWWLDGGPSGWVVLAFADVAGRHPQLPWRHQELGLVMRALDDLTAALTPAPVPVGTAGDLIGAWQGWRRLAETRPAGLGEWAAGRLDRLTELEAGAPRAAAGEALLHLDIRADNLLLSADQVHFVDWAWASRGAGWLDPLFFAASVEMQGGPPAEEAFGLSRSAVTARPDELVAVLAAFAGMLVQHAHLPPPPGLPTLRPFQAALGQVALAWLRRVWDPS